MATRVLFVGNSFVSRNGLPAMVRDLAASAGREMETAAIVAGGASLRRHLNAGTVARALAQAPWNFVVLQEQSTLPIKNPNRYHENVRAMHALIAPTGATTILYMTWARRGSPDSQQQITDAVAAIAQETLALVAPVGLAWQAVRASRPEIDLYAADGSHPTAAGSFLAACVLYGIAFRDPDLQVDLQVAARAPSNVPSEVLDPLADAARQILREASLSCAFAAASLRPGPVRDDANRPARPRAGRSRTGFPCRDPR